MNRPLNIGLLVLGLLGLLPLRLCGLLGGVVVVGTFLLTNTHETTSDLEGAMIDTVTSASEGDEDYKADQV
jgi:hypothetical protein